MIQQKTTKKYLSFMIVMLTFIGIALHDTKIDAMTKLVVALPAMMVAYETAQFLHLLSGDMHTHVDKVSVKETAGKNTSSPPRAPGRRNNDKKGRQTTDPKGRDEYSEYMLPFAA